MQFIHSPLAWAFLLVLIPLLIHLINMMRHKRVKWAAMEFLLASYKKHRKYIWLKQLLLLLARMLAIAVVVAIMAQLVPPDKWAQLFGGKVTHHYVLLDDSYSMTDRTGGQEVFDRAKEVLARIVDRAAGQDTRQRLTLIRFSRAAAADEETPAASVADRSAATINTGEFKEAFDPFRRNLQASQLAVGPSAALGVLSRLLEDEGDETRLVYVVSDFREGEWDNPTELDQKLANIAQRANDVRLVDCVTSQRSNLAITALAPTEGTRSAGVPLFVKVSVKNHGPDPVENLKVTLKSYFYEAYNPTRHGDDPTQITPDPLDERTELIKRIDPGETVTRQVQVYFPGTGKHAVEASLPEDAIDVDNRRYAVVDFPEGEPVLIIDGDPQRRNAYFLSAAFQPSIRGDEDGTSTVRTGIQPTVAGPLMLRDILPDDLRRYRAVYLADVEELDESSIAKLESYANDGGGIAIFLGEQVRASHYNDDWYRNGRGILPLKLALPEILAPQENTEERVPDFENEDHPVLDVFNRGGATYRKAVLIDYFFATEKPGDNQPLPEDNEGPGKDAMADAANTPVRVIATLRDEEQSPLLAEKRFGQGRVMLFTTTLAPIWNNWARSDGGGPSFVVTMLQLHGYLAAPLRSNQSRQVGTPLAVELDPEKFQKEARWIVPSITPLSRKPIAVQGETVQSSEQADTDALRLRLGSSGQSTALSQATQKQGIYEVWAATKTAELDVQRFALNVVPEEGNLAHVAPGEMKKKLTANIKVNTAADSDYESAVKSAGSWSQYLLYALIALLIAEQLLAYSASYHPAAGGAR